MYSNKRAPTPQSLPPDYIGQEITGADRELLERYYAATLSEGGSADEVILRGLRAVLPTPIPVADRLPGAGDCNEDGEVWVGTEGMEYALGDTGDYDWEPHFWALRTIDKWDVKRGRRWLPHWALPLPEVEA